MTPPSPAAPRPPDPDALCELRGVSHHFALPDGTSRCVLANVDVAVRPGEVVALLGPSGCGKSTILRLLAGLLRPTHGEVLYHGAPLRGLNPGVAMVFQSFALFPWMTVAENLRVVLGATGIAPDEVDERATAAVNAVGLGGFEDAYPRELSGGMKQRVGMARALSLRPEMLFMDEPFSQVDALTAESMRAEVLDIWAAKGRQPSSILLVSHDIKEVAFMADRIVVLGANPGTVRTVVESRLPRPRDYRSAAALKLVDQLHDIITGVELPDLPELPEPPGPPPFEPLPDVAPLSVVGLLEYLDACGGREDLFRIAADTQQEFGSLIAAVKAGEMLDLLDTPRRLVVMTPEGVGFVNASAPERKGLWREHILRLRLFQEVMALLAARDHVPRDEVIDRLHDHLPHESAELLFDTLVHWARFGDLFAYDEDEERLSPA
jgi:NitT/TauT family transport system ATP-binding protein